MVADSSTGVNKVSVQKDSLHSKTDFSFFIYLVKKVITCLNIAKCLHPLFSPFTSHCFPLVLNVQGHEKEALQLMATYLPKDTSPGSAYQEGGGLYALGLIHANHGGDIIDYLLNQLKNASNDVCIQ